MQLGLRWSWVVFSPKMSLPLEFGKLNYNEINLQKILYIQFYSNLKPCMCFFFQIWKNKSRIWNKAFISMTCFCCSLNSNFPQVAKSELWFSGKHGVHLGSTEACVFFFLWKDAGKLTPRLLDSESKWTIWNISSKINTTVYSKMYYICLNVYHDIIPIILWVVVA